MINRDRWSFYFGSVAIGFFTVVTAALSLNGCSMPFYTTDVYDDDVGDVGGGDGVVIDLPFAAGYQALCTQGVNGDYSHQSASTENDIDLDTPNGENDLVYAPVGGIVYVHTESASRNFGYHMNIDLGDGTYVVVAHLATMFVRDGEEIAAGQLIGYEGCTGSCSGDHVHVGLHEGDASEMAEYGASQPVNYWLNDATNGAEGVVLASESFVCDVASGHKYESKLVVPSWHPNGSLVKTPDSTAVYRIENSTRRWLETEEVFWDLGYDFTDVALISPAELACYDVGSTIDTSEVWPTEYANEDDTVLLREGDLVKEESASDVYVVSDGVAMPIASYDILLKLGWGQRFIVTVPDGAVSEVVGRVGNCAADAYCVNEEAIAQCATSGAIDVADQGGADDGGTEEEPPDEEPADTGSEIENEDPSSMLEGEIDDGEFGFVFLPPDGFETIESLLIGTVVTDDGNVLDDARVLEVDTDGGALVYTTDTFPEGGVSLYFVVQASEEMGYHYACELSDNTPEAWGTAYAQFGNETLTVGLSTAYHTGIGCSLLVHVPAGTIDADHDSFGYTEDCDDTDALVNPAAVEVCDSVDNDCDGGVDEGDACASETEEDTGEVFDTGEGEEEVAETEEETTTTSSVSEVEICYVPGTTMLAGELYLDGGFFTYWDTAPADAASSYDTEMCATVEAVSGEEVKMNAWFLDASSGLVEWAAYNNWCLAIDWQGTLRVNGAAVSVTTEPWSTADWASDPCNTGGDAYFTVP